MMPQGLFLCGRSQLLSSAGEGLMAHLQGFTPQSVQDLCVDEAITGYPSARIYRNGSDKLATPLGYRREQYIGDRTYEVLKGFVDDLVSSTGPAPTHTVRLVLLCVPTHAPSRTMVVPGTGPSCCWAMIQLRRPPAQPVTHPSCCDLHHSVDICLRTHLHGRTQLAADRWHNGSQEAHM